MLNTLLTSGTQFRPLSLDAPKPLFPIAGKPIIWHHLEALAKVPSVKEVLLIGFYDEYVFRNFIREAEAAFPSFNVRWETSTNLLTTDIYASISLWELLEASISSVMQFLRLDPSTLLSCIPTSVVHSL